jgi:hypothetical protein
VSLSLFGGTGPALHTRVGAKNFRELIVWQLADELRRQVYRLIDATAAARDFDGLSASRWISSSSFGD